MENLSRKCSQTALIDSCLYVAVAEPFEINHRRCDVVVSHPLLQPANVDAALKMPRGVGAAVMPNLRLCRIEVLKRS